jgi:hypothetical protein
MTTFGDCSVATARRLREHAELHESLAARAMRSVERFDGTHFARNAEVSWSYHAMEARDRRATVRDLLDMVYASLSAE